MSGTQINNTAMVTASGDFTSTNNSSTAVVTVGGTTPPTPPGPTPLPMLSEWGLRILAGLVAGYGVWTLRQRPLRRRAQPAAG